MKVVLIVDNPYRDLPSLVLLAYYLCSKGITCYLIGWNVAARYQGREIFKLNPDFVLLNYLRLNNEQLAKRILSAGIKVGILDTEGGVLVNLDSYRQTLASNTEIRNKIACFFSWGNKLADYLIDNNYFKKEQIFVTGTPRYDFYVEPYKKTSSISSSFIDQYSKPIVLINSNFPLGNPQFLTPEQELKLHVEKLGYNRKEVQKEQNINMEAMNLMAGLTNELALDFPNVTFIYRPHPFEKVETYKTLLKPLKNIHLIKKGTVDGWILRASAVIQRSCSTAIESGLIGTPTFSPQWIPVYQEQPLAEAVSIQCKNKAELREMLQSVIDNQFKETNNVQKTLKQIIKDWFYKVDGNAHKRIGDIIISCLQTKDISKSKREKCRLMLKSLDEQFIEKRALKHRIHRIIVNILGLPKTWSFRLWQDMDNTRTTPYVTASVKTRLREIILDILGLPDNYSFSQWKIVYDFQYWRDSEKHFDINQVKSIIKAISDSQGENLFKEMKFENNFPFYIIKNKKKKSWF